EDPEGATVSLELQNVSLQTAVKYLCEQVRGIDKLRSEVEENAVLLLPVTETGGQLETRSYNLPPSLLANIGNTESDPQKLGDQLLENIGADVKITDAAGNLIFKTQSNGGTATWNGQNLNGEKVPTGVYFFWTANNYQGGDRKVAKVLVIR
ncbi:MAG: hypothetical protein EB003_10510, partial [Flavobacteriia bacterium]|nr:hypothetical protein [Flavobacteriia bacterium]